MASAWLDTLSPTWTSVALGLLSLFIILRHMSSRKLDPREPTVLPHWIPFGGHLLGMSLHGGLYIKNLGRTHRDEPIFTLPVPGSRIYVVADPVLAAAVQRNSKTLSFSPLVPDITKRVLGLDHKAVEIIRQNLDPEPGQPSGFLADMHNVVGKTLGPGPYLSELSCEATTELRSQLCEFASSVKRDSAARGTRELLPWIRKFVTLGTARYLFGPNHPLEDNPELQDAFWAFDHGLGGLMIGILPSLTAPAAYRGREKLVAALMAFHQAGHYQSASKIVKDRVRVEEDHGFSREAIARSALSFLFAGIVNTTTTTFWAINRLFADSQLLGTVRQELDLAMTSSGDKFGLNIWSIGTFKDQCPTLMAVLRESLRIGSETFSVRFVKDDVILGDRFWLKKGSVVQISGGILHADKSIWGEDAEVFNPERFLVQKTRGAGTHPAAFRGFGGGKTLCPGRHFAINEMLMLTSMVIYAFDLTGPGGEPVAVAPKNDGVMPVHVLEPQPSLSPQVTIKLRKEAELLAKVRFLP